MANQIIFWVITAATLVAVVWLYRWDKANPPPVSFLDEDHWCGACQVGAALLVCEVEDYLDEVTGEQQWPS